MYMDIQRMRELVAGAYDSDTWRKRVMHLMPERQVVAVYRTMMNRRQLPSKKPKKTLQYEQLSFLDQI